MLINPIILVKYKGTTVFYKKAQNKAPYIQLVEWKIDTIKDSSY
ncbi:hypothetical protein [Sphingobacterium sp. ML3W]|nr:hypothetical protein [Sphingobacterium sp. ML3W]